MTSLDVPRVVDPIIRSSWPAPTVPATNRSGVLNCSVKQQIKRAVQGFFSGLGRKLKGIFK